MVFRREFVVENAYFTVKILLKISDLSVQFKKLEKNKKPEAVEFKK